MKSPLPFLLPLLLAVTPGFAAPRVNMAEDDASHSAYNSGWNSGTNGGMGFGTWVLQQTQTGGEDSFAGFFLGDQDNQPVPKTVAINHKAFGLFANGKTFETAAAFREFNKALTPEDSFSFLMATGPIEAKFETDDAQPGAIGVTVRTGHASDSSDDYNKDARFEFGHYEGQANYQIHDGEADHDSGIPVSDSGVTVTMTPVTADTYDLEVTTMENGETKKFPTRKLGGTEGASLDSFCIFNRDGEKNDAYFNGFQVSRALE